MFFAEHFYPLCRKMILRSDTETESWDQKSKTMNRISVKEVNCAEKNRS